MSKNDTEDRITKVQTAIDELAAELAENGKYYELARLLKVIQEDAEQIRCVIRE